MSGGKTAGGQRWTQTWLGGARSAGAELGHPGERLGLPERGSGAIAGYGRRLVALFADWGLCMVISAALARTLELSAQERSLTTLGLFALQAVVLTATIGMTLGKRLCGIRVVRLDAVREVPGGRPRVRTPGASGEGGRRPMSGMVRLGPVGPVWALVRTLLILTVVPALLWDRDHRGLHDRAANTVVINL